MEAIVDFLADHLMSQSRVTDPLKGEPFETRFYELFKNHLDLAPKNLRFYLHRPGLYGLFFHPPLLDIVEQLLGPEIRLYPNYSARPKLPEWSGTQVLWHQDAGYTSGDGAVAGLRMVNVWTPLVKATAENGCMQFIPGTHNLGAVRTSSGSTIWKSPKSFSTRDFRRRLTSSWSLATWCSSTICSFMRDCPTVARLSAGVWIGAAPGCDRTPCARARPPGTQPHKPAVCRREPSTVGTVVAQLMGVVGATLAAPSQQESEICTKHAGFAGRPSWRTASPRR